MKFSERIGAVIPSTIIQVDGMNDALKNSIWNIIHLSYTNANDVYRKRWKNLAKDISLLFRKTPVDSIPLDGDRCRDWTRKYYYSLEWYHIYDLVEFIADHVYDHTNESKNVTTYRQLNSSTFSLRYVRMA